MVNCVEGDAAVKEEKDDEETRVGSKEEVVGAVVGWKSD